MKTQLTATKSTVKDIETRLSTLSDELEETRKRCRDHKETIGRLKANDLERIEEKKRSNLITNGIPEGKNEPVTTVKQMLTDIGV